MTLRIGTRGSDLALWQARHVASLLERAGERCELVVLVTRGDRIDDVPLQSVEGMGFFTKELEDALREGRIDLAVHSHKDLPGALAADLAIAAIPVRASPAERLLIAPAAHDPRAAFLPLVRGVRVGTSAPRRAAQLAALRADLVLTPLRGNVPTRVRRLREGRHDAIVLAAAGLDRLALTLDDLVVVELATGLFVPAPAQGALAIETRAADRELRARLASLLHDAEVAEDVAAERSLLATLGGGCNLPLGALLSRERGGVRLDVFLGRDHPHAGAPARWIQVRAEDPARALAAARVRLEEARATGQGPLAGLTLALAGSAHSCAELEARLTTLGARVVREVVLVHVDMPAPGLAARLAALRAGDALVVTSAHAARRLAHLCAPAGVLVAAVGSATRAALAASGWTVAHSGNAGAAALGRALTLAPGARVLFPCAEEARDELEHELAARGIALERLVLYRTEPALAPGFEPEATQRLYTSPSAVAAALAFERERRPQATRFALGQSTSAALDAAGLAHLSCASTAPEDILAALVAAHTEKESSR